MSAVEGRVLRDRLIAAELDLMGHVCSGARRCAPREDWYADRTLCGEGRALMAASIRAWRRYRRVVPDGVGVGEAVAR